MLRAGNGCDVMPSVTVRRSGSGSSPGIWKARSGMGECTRRRGRHDVVAGTVIDRDAMAFGGVEGRVERRPGRDALGAVTGGMMWLPR